MVMLLMVKLIMLLLLLTVVMVNVAAFEFLSQTMSEAAAAGIMAAVNGLLAVIVIMAATRVQPGPEEAMVQDIRLPVLDRGVLKARVTNLAVYIRQTMDGSAAATFGLKAGDVIVAVDREDVSSFRFVDVINRIRGEEGVPVSIEVIREGEGKLTFDVERGNVVVKDERGRPSTPKKAPPSPQK